MLLWTLVLQVLSPRGQTFCSVAFVSKHTKHTKKLMGGERKDRDGEREEEERAENSDRRRESRKERESKRESESE